MNRGMITVWPGLVGIMREDAKAMRRPRPPRTVEEYLAQGGRITRLAPGKVIEFKPPAEKAGNIPDGFQE